MRVFLGTIPDYATEVAGVKLAGIRGGSPAEKAGLKGGDVIVEFGGQKVSNIYDYTLRARRGEDWPAGGDRRDARRRTREDHGHAGGEE